MIKLHFDKQLATPNSELVIIAPIMSELFKNEIRFKRALKEGGKYVQFSEIEDCDYVVLPYKWNKNNINNLKIISEAQKHNKKVLVFHIDDSDEEINLEGCIVFRTSFYKSKQKIYERAFPCFKEDNFDFYFLENPIINIGFCGQIITPIRQDTIKTLKESDIETDFLIRNVGWPGIEFGKTKEQVVNEFYMNMKNNLFNLCLRGGGNFSYRLYETMMMGRIPVIVDTDIVLPYENIIDWDKHCVIVKNHFDIVEKIKEFYNKNNVVTIQKNNRKIWEEYLSPLGVIKNITKSI